MAFIPVPNVAQVKLEGTLDSQQTINDMYFQLAGGITLADLQGLVTNMIDWFQFEYTAMCSEDWHTVAVHARDLSADLSFVVDGAPATTNGQKPQESAPGNVCACVSFRTGLGGRSFRGRNYIPAVPNDLVAINTLDPEYISTALAAYALLLPGGGALPGGWEWVVVSRFTGGSPGVPSVPRSEGIATPVTNVLFADTIVDSQRRRLPGRGK